MSHPCRIAAKTLGTAFLPLDFLLLPTLRPLSLSQRTNHPRRKRRNAEEALAFDASYKPFKQQEQRSKLLFDAINQVKQELNATSKNVQEKLHAMGNTPQKKIVTHRFEPTSKYVLLFIGGLALSLVISIWGNFTQWREYQDWEEADLKYRALKMVLPSDDPNVRYIEKFFSVCRDEKVIDDVKNRVAAYEDSVYHHYKMVKMAAIKDSIANSLFKEANEIKKKINKK